MVGFKEALWWLKEIFFLSNVDIGPNTVSFVWSIAVEF